MVLLGCMGAAGCPLPGACCRSFWRRATPRDTGLPALLLAGFCDVAFLHTRHNVGKLSCMSKAGARTDLDINRYQGQPLLHLSIISGRLNYSATLSTPSRLQTFGVPGNRQSMGQRDKDCSVEEILVPGAL